VLALPARVDVTAQQGDGDAPTVEVPRTREERAAFFRSQVAQIARTM
jgi:hypothetical protein